MRDYVLTIVGISLVCAFARMLAPQDEGKGTQPYIKLLCGLLLLSAVIRPISDAIGQLTGDGKKELEGLFEMSGFDTDDYEKIYNGTLIEYSEHSVSSGLKEALIDELGLEYEDIDVYVEIVEGNSGFEAERVTVMLYRGAVFTDPRDIEAYVNRALGCGCEIIYE